MRQQQTSAILYYSHLHKRKHFSLTIFRFDRSMMVKPSSKQANINRSEASMVNHKTTNNDLKDQEPHLSGTYIRTLVKHLTSIKPKDSFNSDEKPPESVNSNCERVIDRNCMEQKELLSLSSPPPSPVKKQVRRRRQTSKPYQERLLNMAEARREIVTALKFHRASMKQRETEGNQYPQLERSASSIVAVATTTDLSSNNNLEYYSSLSCSPPVSYYCPVSGRTGPPPLPPLNNENLDFTLPNQTLGLNLNFQDFINLNANLYHNPLSNYPTSSSSSFSSSSSSGSSSAVVSLTIEETAADRPEEVMTTTTTTSTSSSSSSGAMMSGGLHHVIDEKEMKEIRSLGEQHQMEWNDTVNSLMSAQWFKFLKNIEIEHDNKKFDFDDEINPFDQVIEFSPCMDIGESEGMDGEWLA